MFILFYVRFTDFRLQFEVCRLAALLHRAADMVQPPTLKETKFLLPKPALMQNEVNPQQLVQMVQNNWPQIEALHSVEAKAQFLGVYTFTILKLSDL